MQDLSFLRRRDKNRSVRLASAFAVEELERRQLFALLGVTPGLPDISYVSTSRDPVPQLNYNSGALSFDANGTPLSIVFPSDPSDPGEPILNNSDSTLRDIRFSIQVDNSGNLIGGVPGDDLVIRGTTTDPVTSTTYSGDLLLGEIVQFGYQDGGGSTDAFDFIFTPTGGTLLPFFGSKNIGVTLTSINSTFTGSFATPFSGQVNGDVGPVIKPHVATPTITTEASETGNVVGSAILHDAATIAGSFDGSGSITFTLQQPDNTTITAGTVPVSGDGVYYAPDELATEVGTYTWHASYSGDGLNSGAIDDGTNESVTTIKASPSIVTSASETGNVVGSATLKDSAIISGAYNGAGSITFTLTQPDGNTITVGNVDVAGNGTYDAPSVPATQVGTYTWHASYSGDDLNDGAIDDGTNESVATIKATPNIVTSASETDNAVGSAVLKDSATISGAYNGTGSITFTLTKPDGAISTIGSVPVSGNGTYDAPTVVATQVGTYTWHANYIGDGLNNGAIDDGTNESVATVKASPTITTSASFSGSSVVGSAIPQDKAVLSGGFNESGTITFKLYAPDTTTVIDTETFTPSADGTFTTSNVHIATQVGTYTWKVTYAGDALNNGAVDDGTNESVTTTKATPAIVTTPGVTTNTGNGCYGPIGYWHCKTGQDCVKSCDSGLGNWCSTNYKNFFGCANLYNCNYLGCSAGSGSGWGGMNNSQICDVYVNCFQANDIHKNTYTQACAVALGLYSCGGKGTYNVGSNGAACGVANNTTLSISQILSKICANFSASSGKFYGGDSNLTTCANNILCGINSCGQTPSGPVVQGSETLTDSATLTGGYMPTGSITFYLFAPGVTPLSDLSNSVYSDKVTISGDGTYDTSSGNHPGGYVPLATGTYQWIAVYGGDGNNISVSGSFGDEPIKVGKQSPTVLTTTPNVISCNVGSSTVLKDTADLEGGVHPTGTITFTLVGPTGSVLDTETINVNGAGLYTTPTGYALPTSAGAGTYQWNATYSGDANNLGDTFLNDPSERIVVSGASGGISGIVFCDEDLNGKYDSSVDDLLKGATVTLKQGSITVGTFVTGADGKYAFTGLASGAYSISVSTPAANHFAELSHGSVSISTQPISVSVGAGQVSGPNFPEIEKGGISGFVWEDNNGDGKVDHDEPGIVNVTVKLTGTDVYGNSVSLTDVTDDYGAYSFLNLMPGTYALTESQPSSADFSDGSDQMGSLGGSSNGSTCYVGYQGRDCNNSNCDSYFGGYNSQCFTGFAYNCYNQDTNSCGTSGSAADVFCKIPVGGCGDFGLDYNFGEKGKGLTCSSSTASIAFWHGTKGQALLCKMNGGPNSTALGNWLASQFPNLYGTASGHTLAGLTNVQIAGFYNASDYNINSTCKLDAQVLAAAFNAYVTNSDWAGGTYASSYGFHCDLFGVGYQTINIGSNGAAFGLSNNSTISILQAIQLADDKAIGGIIWGSNSSMRNSLYSVFNAINTAGSID